MRIHRCVCTNQSFAELVDRARREGLSLEQLAQASGATQQCGMCRPYLEQALATGQVVFHELLPARRTEESSKETF